MPKADRAGFPTYWTEFGQGPRSALMIHCSLDHSGSWGGLARYLSGALRMTAFDMPGHGRSGAWDERGEIQKVTTDIAATFCDGPTDLIGHSFGATVALRLAVEQPEKVRSLTLFEPVFFAVALRDRPEMRDAFEEQMKDVTDAFEAGDMTKAARAFTALWGDDTAWSDLSEEQRAQLASQMHVIEAGSAAIYDDAGGLLDDGGIGDIRQRVLLIEGTQSPAIIPAINEGLATRLTRVQRAVVAGAGHMAPITHPGQSSAEILRFLAES